MEKREQYLKWEDYFMGIALLSGQRSKDPATQVGACIVNKNKRIVGVGYNGFPSGISDDEFSWRKHDKDLYVLHAEENAVLNRFSADLEGCSIYVSLFPCDRCARIIIQSGIKEIIYMSDHKSDTPQVIGSKRMLDAAKIEYRKYKPECKSVNIDFTIFGNQQLQFE